MPFPGIGAATALAGTSGGGAGGMGLFKGATLAGTAAASAYSAYSTYQQGRMQEALYNQRGRFAKSEADAERAAQKAKARRVRQQGRELHARQRVSYAKGGVVEGTGTPLLIQTDTAAQIEEEARFISREGDYAMGRGYAQAAFERFQGKQAKRAAKWKAGSTILTGASRVASTAYQLG